MLKKILRNPGIFLFLSAFLFFEIKINSKAVIWDLGYTLVKPKKMLFLKQIGFTKVLKIYAKHGAKTGLVLNNALYKALEDKQIEKEIKGKSCGHKKCTSEKNCIYKTYDQNKIVLPEKFCSWLEGRQSCRDIRQAALENCKRQRTQDPEQNMLLQRLINCIFEPENFAKSLRPIRKMVEILEACKKAKDLAGRPANSLYVLSNFDKKSFEILKKLPKNKRLFRNFDEKNVFISGKIRKLKPKPEIYEYFLKACKLDSKDCVFIDDQEENLKTARELGMETINPNIGHKAVRKRLQELGVLSAKNKIRHRFKRARNKHSKRPILFNKQTARYHKSRSHEGF